jgi:NitT/TauT family transport system ATP-binding protein
MQVGLLFDFPAKSLRCSRKMPQPRISIRHLSKSFALNGNAFAALQDVNCSVAEAEFCCIVGPSGCGKSTLLRILADLDRPTSGELLIDSDDSKRPLTAMVFQEQSIFPWMTVEQNVGYGLRVRRVAPSIRDERVLRYLKKVGLEHFAQAYPHQLSGGMKQRASIARAFATDPQILLMDEPFASVDEQTRALLQEELLRVWEDNRKTVVYITHSIDEALILGDRVLVMSARPGRIKAEVQVDLPRPRSVYEIKSTPTFGALVARVWEPLRQEVLASYGRETRAA